MLDATLAAPARGAAPVPGSAPSSASEGRTDLAGRLHGGRVSRHALLFSLGLIVLLWAALAAVLNSTWNDAMQSERRQNANLAHALGEQTVRVLASADQATIRVRDALAAAPDAPPDLVRMANETGLAPKILVQLSLIDASGHFVRSNLDPDGSKTGAVDLSQREHIRVHLDGHGSPADGLFIGKPVLGKVSNRWTIQLSRKLVGTDGRVLGVVVASLDPSYFEDVYRTVSLGVSGGVTLAGRDLGIRARVIGGKSVGMGTVLATGGAFDTAKEQAEGWFRTTSTLDGVDRIVAFRQVGGYPLYVLVATGQQEALTNWHATRDVMLAMGALASLALALAATLLVVGVRRLENTNQALRVSEAKAQSANQAKSEFLAAISHELRTPLTSIRGCAELMEDRITEPRFRQQACLIRKGAEHLNALLTEILDFAKIEAGGIELVPEPVELRPLLQGTADFFALSANAKGLTLSMAVAPEVPESIHCDGLRLKQILNNLLSNAVKFTEQGAIGIAVDVQGQKLCFHIDDTGPGIAPEMTEAIFEKFRQGDAKVSFQHGGTGLGLALSRGLAQLMKGTLEVASEPGRGSRFTLAIPMPAAGA